MDSVLQCKTGQYTIVQYSTIQYNTITQITQNNIQHTRQSSLCKITKNKKFKGTSYALLRLGNELYHIKTHQLQA